MLNLIPISDANPTRRFPVVTIAFIALNVLAFFQQPQLGNDRPGDQEAARYFYEHAPVPCQMVDRCVDGVNLAIDGRPTTVAIPDPNWLEFLQSIVFSTFLHAGFLHIIGNMLFLWVFGNNIEDHLGRAKFALFYLAGGIAASFAHILWSLRDIGPVPELQQCMQQALQNCNISPYVPAVGASGAVAAVMGAYLLLFPHARVNVLVAIVFIWTVVQMSALAVLGLWFLYQFLIGVQEFSGATEVAWMAHVGGFVFGAIAIFLLGGRPQRPEPVWAPYWR